MKFTYRICITNSLGALVAFRVLATSLSSAISLSQAAAGVSSSVDPQTTQNEGVVDIQEA